MIAPPSVWCNQGRVASFQRADEAHRMWLRVAAHFGLRLRNLIPQESTPRGRNRVGSPFEPGCGVPAVAVWRSWNRAGDRGGDAAGSATGAAVHAAIILVLGGACSLRGCAERGQSGHGIPGAGAPPCCNPFNGVIVAWRQRPDGIGVRLRGPPANRSVVDQRHFAPPRSGQAWRGSSGIDLPGREVPRRAAARTTSCQLAQWQPRASPQGSPATRPDRGSRPAQHGTEQHCRATEAIAQHRQSFVRRETVRTTRSAAARRPASGAESSAPANPELQSAITSSKRADKRILAAVCPRSGRQQSSRLHGGCTCRSFDQPGQRGAKRRPQRLPAAPSAQVVARPARSVDKMVGGELRGVFDGGPVAQGGGTTRCYVGNSGQPCRARFTRCAVCSATLYGSSNETARSCARVGRPGSPIRVKQG